MAHTGTNSLIASTKYRLLSVFLGNISYLLLSLHIEELSSPLLSYLTLCAQISSSCLPFLLLQHAPGLCPQFCKTPQRHDYRVPKSGRNRGVFQKSTGNNKKEVWDIVIPFFSFFRKTETVQAGEGYRERVSSRFCPWCRSHEHYDIRASAEIASQMHNWVSHPAPWDAVILSSSVALPQDICHSLCTFLDSVCCLVAVPTKFSIPTLPLPLFQITYKALNLKSVMEEIQFIIETVQFRSVWKILSYYSQ